jgi:hypothetical protein
MRDGTIGGFGYRLWPGVAFPSVPLRASPLTFDPGSSGMKRSSPLGGRVVRCAGAQLHAPQAVRLSGVRRSFFYARKSPHDLLLPPRSTAPVQCTPHPPRRIGATFTADCGGSMGPASRRPPAACPFDSFQFFAFVTHLRAASCSVRKGWGRSYPRRWQPHDAQPRLPYFRFRARARSSHAEGL